MVETKDGLMLHAEKTGRGVPVIVPQRIYLREYFESMLEGRTAVFYDPRNRGLSETVNDENKLVRGIWHDAEDLEAVRHHYGFDNVAILAHSYISVAALLYAAAHPARVTRMVLIGPVAPDSSKIYPQDLRSNDGGLEVFQEKLAELRSRAASTPPNERCQEVWRLLRMLYVADPRNAGKLHWAPCDIPNEANFMAAFQRYVAPSLAALRWTEATLSRIQAPTLIVHGRKDRSSPYGAGRDWARSLPNARLLTIEDAAHVPWIEAPDAVYGAIRTFLNGAWPEPAERVRRVDS